MKFDAVIIGSGLGSLQCAYILSREGFNVCVIEKGRQLGGCLQTFTRQGCVFDTGMHYIGSMDEGQILNRLFNYFTLTQNLKLKKLDENGYDIIKLGNEEFKFANGYDRFIEKLLEKFPGERDALKSYVSKLKEISNSVDLFHLRDQKIEPNYYNYYGQSYESFLDSITQNALLKKVLLSTSPLYAGRNNVTPLYIPMIIHTSYNQSAYRFIGGASQISDILSSRIHKNGGTIFTSTKATGFEINNGIINAVVVNNSRKIEGKYFISGIHPKLTLSLVDKKYFRQVYRKRIDSLEETIGMFSLHLALHDNRFRYINHNLYSYSDEDNDDGYNYNEKTWPHGYMIHFSPLPDENEYTNSITINTYMRWDEVKQWENTYIENRGADYLAFKQKKAEILLNIIEKDFPGIRSATKAYYTSTPLTYRDYIGSVNGGVYGILKDYKNQMKTIILPRTHISNLFFTGQNINVHGMVGVTLGSLLTCGELLGMPYLVKKIRNAS